MKLRKLSAAFGATALFGLMPQAAHADFAPGDCIAVGSDVYRLNLDWFSGTDDISRLEKSSWFGDKAYATTVAEQFRAVMNQQSSSWRTTASNSQSY